MKTRKNKSREKAGKSLFNSESAGATVIAAVLLLSIIFTVLAVVRIEYIPQWKTDAEQSHMSEVQNDMAELKSTADMVSLFTASDKNSSAYGFSVTVPFSMGGGEIPILEPSKSSGTLSVNTERCRMVITPKRSSITGLSKTVNCGGISYHSDNREYLNQVLRYENGALILAQGERSLMRQFPSFNIKQAREGNYTVSIQAIEIKGEPESISSNIDASLRLTGINSSSIYDSRDAGAIDSFNCTIITKYPDAWISYLNETATNAKLDYGTDYELEKRGSDSVLFSFHPTGGKNLERLYISKSEIQAELGAGGSLDYGGAGDSESDEDESGSERTHANRIVLNKNEKGGIVSSETYIQFKNNKNNRYWVEIDGDENELKKDDIVKLVIDGDQISGTAQMSANRITDFNFNVKMYINGNLVDQGEVTEIWVNGYSGYESTLTYKLPSYLSETQLIVDGKNIISSWPENDSAINIYNIGPSHTNNNGLTMIFDTEETYLDCSGDYEIINN